MSNSNSIVNVLWCDYLRGKHTRPNELRKLSNYLVVFYCLHSSCAPFRRIANPFEISQHVLQHINGIERKCVQCNVTFECIIEQMGHYILKHLYSYIGCSQCNLSSTITMDVAKIKTSSDVTVCPKCNRIYLHGQWLTHHSCRCMLDDSNEVIITKSNLAKMDDINENIKCSCKTCVMIVNEKIIRSQSSSHNQCAQSQPSTSMETPKTECRRKRSAATNANKILRAILADERKFSSQIEVIEISEDDEDESATKCSSSSCSKSSQPPPPPSPSTEKTNEDVSNKEDKTDDSEPSKKKSK